MVAADQTKQHLTSIAKCVSNMSHIAGHSRRKRLQDVRHLARAPVLSYMQKQAAPRAPRVKTHSLTPVRHPILAAFSPKGWNWIREYLFHRPQIPIPIKT
jgi:hypothetical protein